MLVVEDVNGHPQSSYGPAVREPCLVAVFGFCLVYRRIRCLWARWLAVGNGANHLALLVFRSVRRISRDGTAGWHTCSALNRRVTLLRTVDIEAIKDPVTRK